MRLLTAVISLSVVVSCADVESDAGGLASEPESSTAARAETKKETPKEPMCDGSDALRFVYVVEGGGQTITPYYFTEPHGHLFFAIDGKCRYFAEDDYMRGVVSGTLTHEDAEQLSADMHWNELDGWTDLEAVGGCFDASTARLIKPNAAVGCFCDCKSPPIALKEAMTNTTMWLEKLLSEGEPLEGPVAALIDPQSQGGQPEQPRYAWPLQRSIDSIPDLLLQPADPRLVSGSDQWARFADPVEYTKLRELRAQAQKVREENTTYLPAILLTTDKALSDLYVRDELPDGFDQAWKALRASAMR